MSSETDHPRVLVGRAGRAGPRRAIEWFAWDAIAEQAVALYGRLAA